MMLLIPSPIALGADVGYDSAADFSKYKTYAWKEGGWQAPNLLTERRIHSCVEQELGAKGVKKAEGEADLLVMTFAATTTDERADAPSFAGLPNTWTGWSAATTSRGSFSGSLEVRLIDRASGNLIWDGRAYAKLGMEPNPNKVQKKVQKVIAEMFEEYPPPKKK
jgi:hypothetical protein